MDLQKKKKKIEKMKTEYFGNFGLGFFGVNGIFSLVLALGIQIDREAASRWSKQFLNVNLSVGPGSRIRGCILV